MATDYPIEITDPDGSVRIAGLADFTDPDNQPSGPDVQFPFKPAAGDAVTIAEIADGTPAMLVDDDAGGIVFPLPTTFSGQTIGNVGDPTTGADAATKTYVDGGWQPTFDWVTVQSGPPDPIDTYVTPLVTDTTAVTGGSYAWDGSQYQQISAALS